MNGRLESELKEFKRLDGKVEEYPPYVKEWYLNLRASDKTSATCRDYINKLGMYLRTINRDIKNVKPEDMNLENVTNFYISMKTRVKNGHVVNTSDSYKNIIWACLNSFFTFMVKKGYIEENYISYIAKPKDHDLERINANRITLSEDDMKKILDYQQNVNTRLYIRDRAIMLLYMTTGMRKSALVQINLDDIDYENGTISIIDKGDKVHVYNLTKQTIEALNDWLEVRQDTELKINPDALFISKRGDRIASISVAELIGKHCEHALGYKVSPHKIRASFCTLMYEKTKDIEFVRRAVGHSSIATTQRYINTHNNEREKAKEIMEDIFSEI